MIDHSKLNAVLPFHSDHLLSYDRNFIYYATKRSINKLLFHSDKNILVLPSIFDTHPDHLLVAAMGLRIANQNPSIGTVFSSGRHVEEHEVEVKGKLELIEKYYPEEYEELINQTKYGLSIKEYNSE